MHTPSWPLKPEIFENTGIYVSKILFIRVTFHKKTLRNSWFEEVP